MQTFGTPGSRCPLKHGDTIAGRYVVRGVLGSGSTGWVLKVADEVLDGELVALKLIFPHLAEDRQVLQRLRNEATLVRQLSHRNIIHVHDFEVNAEGATFLTMEYLRGVDLSELLQERVGRGLPLDEAALVLTQIAEGLLCAHEQGIIHRDIKPSNVLLGHDGRVKISDFGIAKSFGNKFGLTRTGESIGTPDYMSPEQFRGEPGDCRSDIYAFGILAFELVHGRRPFEASDFYQLACLHLNGELPPMERNGRPLPGWLAELIRKCCEKSPDDRYQSFREIVSALREHAQSPAKLRVRSSHLDRRDRRSRVIKTVIFVAIWLIIAGLAAAQWNVRLPLMTKVLQLESLLGFELGAIKKPFGLHSSLLHPESAFALVNESRALELNALMAAAAGDREAEARLRDMRDDNGRTLFMAACEAAVQSPSGIGNALISAFANSAAVETGRVDTETGETPLTLVVRAGKKPIFKLLLQFRRLAVNASNRGGDTPLHLAVHNRSQEMVSNLVLANASPSQLDGSGRSSLGLATRLGFTDIVHSFAGLGADFGARDADGKTPLIIAAEAAEGESISQHRLILNLLLLTSDSARRGVNARDDRGRTALHEAVAHRDLNSSLLLLEAGADYALRDGEGVTPLALAEQLGSPELVTALRMKACSISR